MAFNSNEGKNMPISAEKRSIYQKRPYNSKIYWVFITTHEVKNIDKLSFDIDNNIW